MPLCFQPRSNQIIECLQRYICQPDSCAEVVRSSGCTGHAEWVAAASCPIFHAAGSSREFSGWEAVPSSSIIDAIMQRASVFLPHLAGISSSDILQSTRVGLRPYAVGGLPAIGPVPGLPGVFVAAGHEGSGLCLGPATAELVVHHLMGGQEGDASQELIKATTDLLPERRLAAV
jgi:glycine/D-amino acid oxidase-like deaminating enzyme